MNRVLTVDQQWDTLVEDLIESGVLVDSSATVLGHLVVDTSTTTTGADFSWTTSADEGSGSEESRDSNELEHC